MLIVSWNVAGLKPALKRIYSDYGSANSSSSSTTTTTTASNSTTGKISGTNGNDAKPSKSPPFHPFANYLHRHGDIDVLAIQESKIPRAQLSDRSEPHLCSTIPGYESFWSCATGEKSRGFNGVVTYAKVGLVKGAGCAPLGDVGLDCQGRCVMTDHGTFVLFNVYVPCTRDAEALHNKMKFLYALKRAMDGQRDKGKHVMLVGDMNLKIDRRDTYWENRVLNVEEILSRMKEEQECGKDNGKECTFPKWKKDIANCWEEISRALQTLEAIPKKTMNPTTKETFDKFRARVTVGENKFVFLGHHEDTAEDTLDCYTFDERSYIDPESNAATVFCKKSMLSIHTLTELMSKICNVSWDEKIRRQIAESSEAGLNETSPAYLWMKALLEEDEMVDVFRHYYPTAEARATCWNQSTNARYGNLGGRIDFTLVDKSLMNSVDGPSNGQTLRCGRKPHINPLGEEAALMAATGGGLFEGGSFSGGGIATATQTALDTQFGEAHCGMIYTPPSYSDHIAVSLLMKSSFKDEFVGQLTLGKDAATRKAQPHKKQQSISSFFGTAGAKKKSSSNVSSKSASSGEKRSISRGSSISSSKSSSSSKRRSVPKHSVLKHFGKK